MEFVATFVLLFSSDPLHDMSVRAGEQIVCIIGVCMLCSGLYFVMVWLEKIYNAVFVTKEENSPDERPL